MTKQAKIKTVDATLVPAIDHNAIANKASTSFLTALGSPRNALVAVNTMFQAIAITRGTQPIVNALNKALRKLHYFVGLLDKFLKVQKSKPIPKPKRY